MTFEGSCGKIGSRAGFWLYNPITNQAQGYSYKLKFMCTNNIAEYEALIIGLNTAKDKGIRSIKGFGDADLIIQQVNNTFQAKHPRLKAYRDEVWRLKDSFDSFCISFIPRAKN